MKNGQGAESEYDSVLGRSEAREEPRRTPVREIEDGLRFIGEQKRTEEVTLSFAVDKCVSCCRAGARAS